MRKIAGPGYKVVINDEEMFLDALHYFKRFLPNTTNKENLTTDNKKSLSTCVSMQNPDCVSFCIITKNVAKKSELSETHRSAENIQLPLCFTDESFNERLNNSKLNTSTEDFATSMPLHESTPLKTGAPKLKDLTKLHHEEDKIEFNQHNAVGSKADEAMSNTAKILQKITGDDPLVVLFNKARKNLKSLKTDENIKNYWNIIAKLEVRILLLKSTIKKELKIIENETLTCNDSIALQPEKGHSRENYDEIINKLKMVKILRKELEI